MTKHPSSEQAEERTAREGMRLQARVIVGTRNGKCCNDYCGGGSACEECEAFKVDLIAEALTLANENGLKLSECSRLASRVEELETADEMRGRALSELSMMQSDRDDLRTALDDIVERAEKYHYAPTLSTATTDGMLCNVIDMAKKALEFSRRREAESMEHF